MSDNENEQEKPFSVDVPKQGRATCKKCKEKCLAGELRIAKLAYNPFGSGKMKSWHHLPCLFEQFLNQRLTTKRLTDPYDIDGWDTLEEDYKNDILRYITETEKKLQKQFRDKYSPQKPTERKDVSVSEKVVKKTDSKEEHSSTSSSVSKSSVKNNKDNLFREFRRLTADVTNENSYLEKSAIIKKFLTKGSDGTGFNGDIVQWCRMLLPGVIKRIYNLQSKQLVKLLSSIFGTNRDDMLTHLEQGDIGETIQHFFENATHVKPAKKSLITMQEVDDFLEELTNVTKEDDQIEHFNKIVEKCTGNDLKVIIRLIKHDLRMNAGAKHVLDAVHQDAYQAFQASRDLPSVLNRILGKTDDLINVESKSLKAKIQVMTPVLPMLAEACKSVEQAMKKCPNGMYSEIKYDGERVQVHKHKSDFKYFSRSLKPVMPHKVSHFKEFIPKAFPHATDIILDSEVLLIDTKDGKPLPFGSLGVHKKEAFKDANVCLFVFDCIYYNGESLTHKTMKERRQILRDNMSEIPNRIMFSETEEVHKADDLAAMITKVLKLGLEGLVLKDMNSIYEPGKRHWLKVKKDYLCDGAMADTADLIVLGAWFGTGKKGGMMSVFLMGCYDQFTDKFCTVTKVHTGHDDKTLEQLQSELDMIKISGDINKLPTWLKCNRQMVPDFIARDPKQQPIWEVTGAEFTQNVVHTADGISIRFPRVTHIRSDKDWKSATNLQELKKLFKTSKENTDFSLLTNTKIKTDNESETSKKVQKTIDTSFIKKKIKIENESDEEHENKKKIKKLLDIDNNIKNEPISYKIKQENIDIKKEENMSDEIQIKEEIDSENEMQIAEISAKRKTDECLSQLSKKIKNDSLSDSSSNSIRIGSNMYPGMFRNTKVILANDIKDKYDNILRHFFAVGGNIAESEDWEEATYVIHNENGIRENVRDWPKSVRHITIDWIKDSIGNERILDVRPYTVHWLPT